MDPDEYLEDDIAEELGQYVAQKEAEGTIPGLWSPQGSEKGEDAKGADTASGEEYAPVDEEAVNSDIDSLINRLRKETGLADVYGRVQDLPEEESEVTYSDASAQRVKETIGLTTAGIIAVEGATLPLKIRDQEEF